MLLLTSRRIAACILGFDFLGGVVSAEVGLTGDEKVRTSHEEINAIAGLKSKFMVKSFFKDAGTL
jgi:hypothetical protein